MKYKDNALNRINQLDATGNRIIFQLNRREPLEEVFKTVESLKNQIDALRQMIDLESDELR